VLAAREHAPSASGHRLPDDYFDLTTCLPQVAADLLHRASRQPWAKCGLTHRRKKIHARSITFGNSPAANHRISLDLNLRVRNRKRSNGD
jgi:hypothetical protein